MNTQETRGSKEAAFALIANIGLEEVIHNLQRYEHRKQQSGVIGSAHRSGKKRSVNVGNYFKKFTPQQLGWTDRRALAKCTVVPRFGSTENCVHGAMNRYGDWYN